ncbi:hypothetical protein BJV82DRAFT_606576 [Fennellomyces sp. T-0311]|nr:hypothetical protein BJV82DRAFT_606576 [Fennellomyces sp. T-0311]
MKLKVDIARRAYAAGVKQIVDMSSISVNFPWRSTLNSVVSRTTEETILAIPNRGTYIALRPFFFMSNHLQPGLFNSTRDSNTIVDIYEPDQVQEWISTNDMGVITANIFQDPVEKHGDAVYELIGDVVSLKDRAALLSKILGRTFVYKKVTPQEQYSYLTQTQGLPHSVAYAFLHQPVTTGKPSPGLSVLLGRSPETLEQWIEANKANIP